MDFSQFRSHVEPIIPLSPENHLEYLKQLCIEIPRILPFITRETFPPTDYQVWNYSILKEGLRQLRYLYRFWWYLHQRYTHRPHVPDSIFHGLNLIVCLLQTYLYFWDESVLGTAAVICPDLVLEYVAPRRSP